MEYGNTRAGKANRDLRWSATAVEIDALKTASLRDGCRSNIFRVLLDGSGTTALEQDSGFAAERKIVNDMDRKFRGGCMTSAFVFAVAAGCMLITGVACAQGTPTQAVITAVAKGDTETVPVTQKDISIKVDGKKTPITAMAPLLAPGEGVQLMFVMDSALKVRVGREIDDIGAFFNSLPPSVEVGVGYMLEGRTMIGQNFTTDHALAVKALHLPIGGAGISASPYFCLSDLVKNWPSTETGKARTVIMITDGIDRYNGARSMDLDDPYVNAAIQDSQNAGVSVSSIYFLDAGFVDRTQPAMLNGQSLLQQVSEATDGVAYYQGEFNPVSFTPFLNQYTARLKSEYVATFLAPGQGLVSLKANAERHHLKVSAANRVVVGNMVSSGKNP